MKETLFNSKEPVDRLGRRIRDLRISLIDRCNLRCTYCMPKEIFGKDYPFLRKADWLRFSELDAVVEAFVSLGVRKIRLTGGEPLLRPGLVKFIRGLHRFDGIEDIALTTNGLRLAEMAGDFREAGLSRLTVSLDGLDDAVVGKINGKGVGSGVVLAGIKAALAEGFAVKVNMVVQRGVNESEILPMADWCKAHGVLLRFIEFMDVGNHNGWNWDKVVPAREILERLQTRYSFVPMDVSSLSQVAKEYEYVDGGRFGLITSVSQPFCRGCNRARITADGKLFTCLFAKEGWDLKRWMRTGESDAEGLREYLSMIWRGRSDRYSEVRQALSGTSANTKAEMFYVGG